MSREALLEARELIKAKRYDEARFILKSMADHPIAQEWLAKLNQIAPVTPKAEENPFESPFEDPFTATPKRNPIVPPLPRPTQPQPEVWVNDRTFGKPAKKDNPQISNGVMILAVGGMLVVAAVCLGIIALLRGGGDNEKDASNNDNPSSSFFDLGDDNFFELEMINRGELRYGDIQDDLVANDTGHIWTFQGNQGDRIDIAIQSTWDNVLRLEDANGNLIRENDDQAGGEFAGDARLYDIRLPSTGTYRIVVKPWAFIGGTYRLWLTRIQ